MIRPAPVLALTALSMALAVLPSPLSAANGKKGDSVGQDAVDAATQPLSDLGLRKRKIPLILLRAEERPYALGGLDDCDALRGEIARMERVLGPDADSVQKQGSAINKGLKLGGRVLGGFIPFRGLVREFSGANEQRQRWESAIYSGVARRSFLKGYLAAKGCASAKDHALQSASEVLGMTPPKAEEGTSGQPVDVPAAVPVASVPVATGPAPSGASAPPAITR